eukprot:UN03469
MCNQQFNGIFLHHRPYFGKEKQSEIFKGRIHKYIKTLINYKKYFAYSPPHIIWGKHNDSQMVPAPCDEMHSCDSQMSPASCDEMHDCDSQMADCDEMHACDSQMIGNCNEMHKCI